MVKTPIKTKETNQNPLNKINPTPKLDSLLSKNRKEQEYNPPKKTRKQIYQENYQKHKELKKQQRRERYQQDKEKIKAQKKIISVLCFLYLLNPK